MKHQTIVSQDIELLTLLIARKLDDDFATAIGSPTFSPSAERYGINGQWTARFSVAKQPITINFIWNEDERKSLAGLVETAVELAEAVQRVADAKSEFAEIVAEVRAAAKKEIAKAVRRGMPWKLLNIEPTPIMSWSAELPSAKVTIEMLDRALRPVPVWMICDSAEELREHVTGYREDQKERAEWKTLLAKVGADGLIDRVTLAAIAASGDDFGETVRSMTGDGSLFPISCGDGKISLVWDDGLIVGTIPLAPGIDWRAGVVTVAKDANIRKRGSLVGKPLARIVSSPLIAPNMIIVGEYKSLGELKLRVDHSLHFFDSASGMLIEMPD